MRPESLRAEVLVVGAGAVGAAAALALVQAGFEVALADAEALPASAPDAEADLRVYALSGASLALLDRLGALAAVRATRFAPYRAMRVWDGEAEIAFEAALIGERTLGGIVEDRVLRAALAERLRAAPRLDLLEGAALEALDVAGSGRLARFADGRTVRARVVIAADGARSAVRAAAGLAVDASPYGERAVVANVRTERGHADTAWQRFTPDGPLAFLPLADGRCGIVWSLPEARAAEVLALDDAAFRDALGAAFAHRLGAVLATSPRAAFPLALALAPRYAADRVALAGDAAHVVHPLAGQGMNLGLLDAAALAEVLATARAAGEDPGDAAVLARYAAWRRNENAVAARSFDLLDRLFRSEVPGVAWLRRQGLALAERALPLKRRFALHAAGWAGRVPALARRLA